MQSGFHVLTALVSALGLGAAAGAAAPQATLSKVLADGGVAGDEFGDNVAVSGDLAVVGARIADGAVGAVYVFRRVGGAWAQEARLTPPAGSEPFTLFGNSVAISSAPDGDVIAVGAPIDLGPPGVYSGRAYVYRHDGTGWQLEASLYPADATDILFYGALVAVDRDLLVVGAPADELSSAPNTTTGTVHLYIWDGAAWVAKGRYTGSNVFRADQFGSAVAASDRPGLRRVVVGASNEDHVAGQTTGNEGAAYVFREDAAGTWYEEARLTAPVPRLRDIFGWSVAIEGDWVAVGALLDDAVAPDGGAVHLFHAADWTQPAQPPLAPLDLQGGDRFGDSVDFGGDLLAVGARWHASKAGACYGFRWDGASWVQSVKLANPDPATDDMFGSAAVDGAALIAGAYGDDEDGADAGAVYFGVLSNTPDGPFVAVAPVDAQTGTAPVVLTFDLVTSGGTTTVSTLSSGPALPSGFELGTSGQFYELSTDATFVGEIEVCFAYDESDFVDESHILLWHHDGMEWVDVTTSLDVVGNVICGEVSSLSPFAVLQPSAPIEPGTALRDLSDRIAALELQSIIAATASAQRARRDGLSARCHLASRAVAEGNTAAAEALASTVLAHMDGVGAPADWLVVSPETTAIAVDLAAILALLQGL